MGALSRREVLRAGSLGLVAVTFGAGAGAREMMARDDLEAVFEGVDVVGTFVAFDVRANRFTFVYPGRAETGYSPASTFKVPNTLIAYAVGIVQSGDAGRP